MQRIGVGTVAALLLSFTPALAADPVVKLESCNLSGVIGGYGNLGSHPDYLAADVEGFGLFGKANFCDVFGTGVSVQSGVYGEFDKADDGLGNDNLKADTFGYVSHYYYRNNDFAVGLLSGLGQASDDIYSGPSSETIGVFGLDAHAYLDRLTFAGQFAYWNTLSDNSDTWQIKDAYQISGELRYFPFDNFKLVGHAAYDQISNEADVYPWKSVSFGVGAEYQFNDFPVSVFADYTRTDGKIGSSSIGFDQMDIDLFSAGLAIHFNSDSLIEEDRMGPSFATPMIDPFTSLLAASWQQN